MLCKDCEYFKILYEPQIIGGQMMDWGKAICKKHNLETDFITHHKFKKLSCIENNEGKSNDIL